MFREKAPDGKMSTREHYEIAARWDEGARKMLQGPKLPDGFAYLWRWAGELYGRSGVGMSGAAPLNPLVIEGWARGVGETVTPREFRALMRIDTALRGTVSKKKDKDEAPKRRIDPPWPERKR